MFSIFRKDPLFVFGVLFLLILSSLILNSISTGIFPLYFISLAVAILAFWVFSLIDFEIIRLFSVPLYILSIILLALPLIIGTVTRGTIRWVQVGPINFQPAEIVRPFLLVFFAHFLTVQKIKPARFFKGVILAVLPVFLILIAPSFGVSVITFAGFCGVLLSSNFNKKHLIAGVAGFLLLVPLVWILMAPYQKDRILTFVNPSGDPLGAGYNSLQSMIAAGSGKFFGLGLGHGIQTQLSFLPESETDFIFASSAEELGFLGAFVILAVTFFVLLKLINFMEASHGAAGRAYISGFFVTLLVQIFIHVGMNIGLTPVTGVPYPLLSAGGSSLVATMIGLGIAYSAYKGHS